MADPNISENNPEGTSKIIIHDLKEIILTDQHKIIYCKAEGSYTRIYLVTHNFIVTKVLRRVESILAKDTFVRIHKSYLININHVSGIKHNDTIILEPDTELPIARRKKHKLLKRLSENHIII